MHGDDFVVEGKQSDLEWVWDVLAAKKILKVRGILGPEQGDQKKHRGIGAGRALARR